MASCAPCQSSRPLQTTSMCRALWTGTSMLVAESTTLRLTRAPASWQTRAMARSRGRAREASTPDVEQAARCLHTHQVRRGRGSCAGREEGVGAGAAGARHASAKRERQHLRRCRTVSARADCGPACESSRARDAGTSQQGASRACARRKHWRLCVQAAEEVGKRIVLGRGRGTAT